MYTFSADEAEGVLVGMYDGREDDESDYARCVGSIVDSDAAAELHERSHVCILVLQTDTERPPAVWRKRMAEANRNLRAKEYHFAVVSPNPLQRGVLTAILWISGSRANHHYAAFATWGEATAWVRQRTGRSYPTLDGSYERLEAEALALQR